jgi:hypothetical protein
VKRRIQGLHEANRSAPESISDGLFLVRVERAQYRWQGQKPYYLLRFAVIEPNSVAGCPITGRIFCTPRVLWKLSWFLRDFGYDTELLGRDEIDEKALVGLRGVVKISDTVVHGLPCSISTASPQPGSGKNCPLPRLRVLTVPR